jgi:hypothetical protein
MIISVLEAHAASVFRVKVNMEAVCWHNSEEHKLNLKSHTGVFLLTWMTNRLRVKKINVEEQFIMAYGGLRGAIAFSMVETLNADLVEPRPMFVTTTLIVIIFTVFIQVEYCIWLNEFSSFIF